LLPGTCAGLSTSYISFFHEADMHEHREHLFDWHAPARAAPENRRGCRLRFRPRSVLKRSRDKRGLTTTARRLTSLRTQRNWPGQAQSNSSGTHSDCAVWEKALTRRIGIEACKRNDGSALASHKTGVAGQIMSPIAKTAIRHQQHRKCDTHPEPNGNAESSLARPGNERRYLQSSPLRRQL